MNTNWVMVVSGLIILFGISYLLISMYSMLYLKYAAKVKPEKRKFWLGMAIVTLAYVVASLVSIMFASSSSLYIFAAISAVLIFTANYFLVERFVGLKAKHKIFFLMYLSVIINPVWYFIFKG